jgi:hypothetical protein
LNRPKNLLKRILICKLVLLVKETKTFLSNNNVSINQLAMWYFCNSMKRKNNNQIIRSQNNKCYSQNSKDNKNKRFHKNYYSINKSKYMQNSYNRKS